MAPEQQVSLERDGFTRRAMLERRPIGFRRGALGCLPACVTLAFVAGALPFRWVPVSWSTIISARPFEGSWSGLLAGV